MAAQREDRRAAQVGDGVVATGAASDAVVREAPVASVSTPAPASPAVPVLLAPDGDRATAERLAAHLGAVCVPLTDADPAGTGDAANGSSPVALRLDARGLALVGDGMELRADLTRMLPRLRPVALARELIVRAARIKHATGPCTAVDATAGLGEDALLLAAAGFAVTLFERDAVIAALLADGLRRAAAVPELADAVRRMRLVEGDSIAGLAALPASPDVVLLDPMFPGRTKRAAVKKKFQLLHHLEQPATDEGALLAAARAAHPRKIVIKRPPKGPFLAGEKPSYSLTGKAVRIDVIALPRPAAEACPGGTLH